MPLYPAQIDNFSSLPLAVDNSTPVPGDIFNKLRTAVLQIETELGITPRAIYTTVRNRLDQLEFTLGNLQIISLAGDLGGTLAEPKVIQIQGRPVVDSLPPYDSVLAWNGNAWEPKNLDIISLSGDLGGTLSSPKVIGLQGRDLLDIAPLDGYVIAWDTSAWLPKSVNSLLPTATAINQVIVWDGTDYIADTLNQDDISVGYKFDLSNNDTVLFTVGETVNPQVNVSYDFDPDLVIVTNDQSLPDENVTASVLSSNQFTTANSYLRYAFDEKVIITIKATKGRSTKSINRVLTWGQPIFWGVGEFLPGNFQTFLESLDSELTNTINASFQVNASITEKVYFACRSGYGNGILSVNGMLAGFNKIQTALFDNGHGFIENYDLYESDNYGLGDIIVTVSPTPSVL